MHLSSIYGCLLVFELQCHLPALMHDIISISWDASQKEVTQQSMTEQDPELCIEMEQITSAPTDKHSRHRCQSGLSFGLH